jgi:hypothetical protein
VSASNDEELAILDARFGSGTPTTWYVGLSTATTEPADDGTGVTEPSGGGYARVEVANTVGNFPAATLVSDGAGGQIGDKTHANAVTFPTATADWGTAHWGLMFPAATGGTYRYRVQLDTAKAVATGDTPSFAAGALHFRVD